MSATNLSYESKSFKEVNFYRWESERPIGFSNYEENKHSGEGGWRDTRN